VVSGAVTTNKATISSIQTFMQGNLDLGVTSVGITLGSSGTDVSVSGSPITSSGNITINLPTASATNRGALSSADWSTFNSKQGAITLTTTGTSGASTLVGNTLNIPNYSTDLSGYVTLGTAQTITAQKTFTTSGSSDTMIISHGSGSGFALDVIKAGNGEAIRVQKTSGSGNAMTISGGNFEAGTIVKTGGTSSQFLKADGSVDSSTYLTTGSAASTYLPLAGGTLTGALGGTSANFTGSVGIGTITPEGSGLTVASGGILVSLDPGAARKVLELYATSTGAKVSSSYVGASSYGNLELLTSGLARLTIADTGAATFSSSVGIGVSPTAGKLHILAPSSVSYAPVIAIRDEGNPTFGFTFKLDTAVNGDLRLDAVNSGVDTPLMTFKRVTGIVGIGTASPGAKLQVSGTVEANGSLYRAVFGTTVQDADLTGISGGNGSEVQIQSPSSTRGAFLTIGGGMAFGEAMGGIAFYNSNNVDGKRNRAFIVGGQEGATAGEQGSYLIFGTVANTISVPSERMRITSGGYLKASNNGTYFGPTNPSHEFNQTLADWNTQFINTNASAPYGIFLQYNAAPNNTSSEFLYCRDNSGSTIRATIRSNGGLANYQTNNVNLSDERTKKDIEPLESYWDKFKAIEIVKFKYIDQTHDDFNIGVIAQQVEAVAPEFVDVDGWNTKPELDEEGNEIISEEEPLKSIYTADLHHATIKVLQEAMAKIEKLEEEISSLKNQIK
jgi:hypothetical protein